LSGQIKKLEEELGSPLFERHTRKVFLTPFGEEALPIVNTILEGVGELKNCAQMLQDPRQGTLRIGIFPTLGPWLFPRLVKGLSEEFPQLEIQLVEEQSHILSQGLISGELDTAFLAMPNQIPNTIEEPLFSEEFLLALPENHPWAFEERIEASRLQGQQMLLLNDGHCFRDQALDICLRYGATERQRYHAASIETLRQMVRLGGGITLIPKLAVPEGRESGIVYKPMVGGPFQRNLALYYRKTHPRRVLLQEMVGLIRRIGVEEVGLQTI